MARVTVFIDVATAEGPRTSVSVDTLQDADRRTSERRNPAQHGAVWQPQGSSHSTALARPYGFRSFIDRRAQTESQHYDRPQAFGHAHSGTAHADQEPLRADRDEMASILSREEVLVRISGSNDDGAHISWLHLKL